MQHPSSPARSGAFWGSPSQGRVHHQVMHPTHQGCCVDVAVPLRDKGLAGILRLTTVSRFGYGFPANLALARVCAG
jgi:hypothetical protein